jgi:tetratricopeptide (TPR) repeat protein
VTRSFFILKIRWLIAITALSLPARSQGERTAGDAEPSSREASAAERARTWFEEGQAAYARGEFQIAANLFRAVYQATHASAVLYDLAQAERRAKECAQALTDYEEYLREAPAPTPEDVGDKIAEMRRCATKASASPPGVAEAPLPTPVAAAPPTRRDTSGKHAVLRAVTYGSAGGALVCAALGTVFLLRAQTASSHLNDLNRPGAAYEPSYASYQSSLDRNNHAAAGFFVASGLMAAAATSILVVQWISGEHSTKSALAVVARGRGLGLSYSIGF